MYKRYLKVADDAMASNQKRRYKISDVLVCYIQWLVIDVVY